MEDVFKHLSILAKLQLGQVPRYVLNELIKRQLPWSIDIYGNIAVRKGEPNRGVVAHMDFVEGSKQSYYQAATNTVTTYVKGKPVRTVVGDPKKIESPPEVPSYGFRCVGGDDKVGVALCLALLDQFENLFVLFTEDEESGCIGANNFDLKMLEGIDYLVEFDRRGIIDVVNNVTGLELCSKEFLGHILSYDSSRKPSFGLSTDVGTIKERGWKGNCVNLSCGYYNPHTPGCFIVPAQVLSTYVLGKKILANMPIGVELPREIPDNVWYGDYWGYGFEVHNGNKSDLKEAHFRKRKSFEGIKETTEEKVREIVEGAFEGTGLIYSDFEAFKHKHCSQKMSCVHCIHDGVLYMCVKDFVNLVEDLKQELAMKTKEAKNNKKPEEPIQVQAQFSV